MARPNLAACDRVTGALVLADDLELLVHGRNEEPLWRRTLGAPVVGVGAGGGQVVSIDASGELVWWSSAGERQAVVRLPDQPLALDVSRAGDRAVVLLDGRVALATAAGAPRTFVAKGATCAALSWDGASVAIGTEAGDVRLFAVSGELLGVSTLETAVRSLAPSPSGAFYAAAGDRLLRVPAQGGEPSRVTRAGGKEPDCLSVSSDGTLFAVRLDDKMVLALGDPPGETVVQLVYVDRVASGVTFGPGRMLHVALGGGDANYVDIMAQELRRSDTFEGRTHNRWLVSVAIEPEAAPPAPALAPATPAPAPALGAAPLPAGAPAGKKLSIAGALFLVAFVAGLGAVAYALQEPPKKKKGDALQEQIDRSIRDSLKKTPSR